MSEQKENQNEILNNTTEVDSIQPQVGVEVRRKLKFDMTEQQLAEKAREAGKLRSGLNELLAQYADVKRDWSGRIKKAETQLSALELLCHEGKDLVEVACTEIKNHENQTIEYWHQGTLMESRSMTDLDRQDNLNLKDANEVLESGENKTEDEDIADVIQEETKIKTKRSSIDDSFGNGHADMSGLYDITETPQ